MDQKLMTYSPAPWDFEEDERDAGEPGRVYTEGTGEFRLLMGETTFEDVDGSTLTIENEAIFTGPNAQHNARLCPEAPAMLQALRDCLDILAVMELASKESREAAMKNALAVVKRATDPGYNLTLV